MNVVTMRFDGDSMANRVAEIILYVIDFISFGNIFALTFYFIFLRLLVLDKFSFNLFSFCRHYELTSMPSKNKRIKLEAAADRRDVVLHHFNEI